MDPVDHAKDDATPEHVEFHGDGVLRLGDRVIKHVHADLIGGRSHYSVGRRVAEGPRWWRARVEWDGDDDQPVTRSEVIIEVDNGRSGVAVVEPAPNAPARSAVLHRPDPAQPTERLDQGAGGLPQR